MPKQRTISRLEKPDTVSTRRARRTASRVVRRRRKPSFGANHSGWAANETSWTVTTIGTPGKSGPEYAGANNTSAPVWRTRRGRTRCSHHGPLPSAVATVTRSRVVGGVVIEPAAHNTNSWVSAPGMVSHARSSSAT